MEPKPDFDYLYLAICKNDTALLHYALGRGMDINCVDKDGQGGLFHAFNRGAQAIPFFKYLVEAGANLQCYSENKQPLLTHVIVNTRHHEYRLSIMEFLLSKGAHVNAQDRYGSTALHVAVLFNLKAAVVKLLGENTIDKTIKNKDGKTPLDFAAGKVALMRLLQEKPQKLK